MLYILLFLAFALLVWVVVVCRRTMTLCLTFDDGLLSHYKIVAPLLEEKGWSGAFNVPTRFMDSNRPPLTKGQLEDCCLTGHEEALMTWENVRNLLARGHEVYPHTCDHLDLVDKINAGDYEGVVTQVGDARDAFIKNTGIEPRFFCLPHNRNNPEVTRIIRNFGMEPFSCARLNFGEPGHCNYFGTITDFLLKKYYTRACHVDIMIHGITKDSGGWRPFADVAAFKSFLAEISELEKAGKVKVVPYADYHYSHNILGRVLSLYDWLTFRVRNLTSRAFRILVKFWTKCK